MYHNQCTFSKSYFKSAFWPVEHFEGAIIAGEDGSQGGHLRKQRLSLWKLLQRNLTKFIYIFKSIVLSLRDIKKNNPNNHLMRRQSQDRIDFVVGIIATEKIEFAKS